MEPIEQSGSEAIQEASQEQPNIFHAEAAEGADLTAEIDHETEAPVRPKRWPIIVAVLALILLTGATFLGARLLNAQQEQPGQQMMNIGPGEKAVGSGSMTKSSVRINMEPAPELPAREADKVGAITEIKDKSIMVGSGPMTISVDESGEVKTTTDQTQPSTEVVITAQTKMYRDTTFDNQPPQGEEAIQQVVEPASFSDFQADSFVSVWGYQRGDRLIAEVVLYTQPAIFKKAK